MTKMLQQRFTVRMLTPAFLGDAEQSARWRTPPFKHLLRQWWRVVWAANHRKRPDLIERMRWEEGMLFGNAWLSHREGTRTVTDHHQSRVRLRFEPESGMPFAKLWHDEGTSGVAPLPTTIETSHAWFGLARRGQGQADRRRLEANDSRQLALAWPDESEKEMRTTLWLIHHFGTVGSRSRGGWGSIMLEPMEGEPLDARSVAPYLQALQHCLEQEWPSAIACDADGRPWIWHGPRTFPSWDQAMKWAALQRREIRSCLKLGPRDDMRPILGFAGKGRMPSPLHWKIVAEGNQLRVRVAALPHRLPENAPLHRRPTQDLIQAWLRVRDQFDQTFARLA